MHVRAQKYPVRDFTYLILTMLGIVGFVARCHSPLSVDVKM
jgi:hypothetical protein